MTRPSLPRPGLPAGLMPPVQHVRRYRRPRRSPARLLLAFLALSVWPSVGEGAGVKLTIQPKAAFVSFGDSLDLELFVPAASDSFNAYEVTIGYDPALLSVIQLTPLSLQEGPLMTEACPNRFHVFDPDNGSVTISHSLLCAGVRVAGPGVLYRLRFSAGLTEGSTDVEFTSALVADGGIPVTPAVTVGATVFTGDATSVSGVPGGGLGVNAFPNPFRTKTRLRFVSPEGGPGRITVTSHAGRLVRTLAEGSFLAEEEIDVFWDGRDEEGAPVPAGIYFVTGHWRGARVTHKLLRLR